MKDKNGFTLIELLAVIAILAILVIVALPNVIKMFNDSRKQTFINETKNIYRTAQQQWLVDNMEKEDTKIYARCDGCTSDNLKLTGRNNLDYFIVVDSKGVVILFFASDGRYQAQYDSESLDGKIDIKDIIDAETISELDDGDIISIADIESLYLDEYVPTIIPEITNQCMLGKYYDENSDSCVSCPVNTYKDHLGNDGCTPCPYNKCTGGKTGAMSSAECNVSCGGSIIPIRPPALEY